MSSRFKIKLSKKKTNEDRGSNNFGRRIMFKNTFGIKAQQVSSLHDLLGKTLVKIVPN